MLDPTRHGPSNEIAAVYMKSLLENKSDVIIFNVFIKECEQLTLK